MFNWSLRNKLTLVTSIAVVAVAFIVAAVGFIESKNSMESDVQRRVENSATSYANYVSNWFAYKGEALDAMPENTPRLMMSSNLRIIRDAGKFENVFLAYGNGVQNNANNVTLPLDNNDPRKWGWYINALKDKSKVYIDNPTIAAATNQVVVSLGKAMMLQGDTQVVLGADVDLQELNQALSTYHLPGNSSIALVSDTQKIVTSVNPQIINKDIRQLGFTGLNMSSESVVQQKMQINGQAFQVYLFPVPNTTFKVMISLDEHSLITPLYDIAINQLLLALGVIIITLLLNVVIINKLLKPLVKVTQSLKEISQGGGDLTQRIQVLNNDEIGQLSRSFNEFVESQRTLISHVVDQTESLQVVAKDSYERSELVNQVLSVQQDEVTMVATSIQQLSCSTGEIAANADLAANSAQQSSLMADKGVLTVEKSINSITDLSNEIQQTYTVIGELSNHVQNIDSILVAIQTVAEQTNLLALNAAIEAARAGEQGRGFAVVADEVRVLSQRTHQSTEEIQRTIETLRSTMNKATTHMESSASLVESSVQGSTQVAQAFEEINTSITTISDMSTQIAAAVEEQTTVTRDVSSYVASIKNEADKLALNAQENIQQAEELTAQSDSLHSKVATFTV